jgi:hypothetical protein
MISSLYNKTFFQHHNLISMLDCTQSMSHNNNGAPFEKLVEMIQYDTLIYGIQRIGRFI